MVEWFWITIHRRAVAAKKVSHVIFNIFFFRTTDQRYCTTKWTIGMKVFNSMIFINFSHPTIGLLHRNFLSWSRKFRIYIIFYGEFIKDDKMTINGFGTVCEEKSDDEEIEDTACLGKFVDRIRRPTSHSHPRWRHNKNPDTDWSMTGPSIKGCYFYRLLFLCE